MPAVRSKSPRERNTHQIIERRWRKTLLPEVKEEPLKKNEIPGVEPEAKDTDEDEKTPAASPATPSSNLKDDDDEDEWANLPSFLRRK
jgi:hypothetical protein